LSRWLLVSWIANAVTLGITGLILSGVTFHHSVGALFASAAVFGVLNTILKPILKLLTLPFAIITLGLAWFFVSLFMLWLTQAIVPDFDIDTFWWGCLAAIIVSIVNWILQALLPEPE